MAKLVTQNCRMLEPGAIGSCSRWVCDLQCQLEVRFEPGWRLIVLRVKLIYLLLFSFVQAS